jgi:AbrB family looped-hinge helix DNA binding protein
MQKQAKIRGKGQVTVPREIRQILRLRAGDRLIFESDGTAIRARPLRKSAFSKYRGIGNLRSGLGKTASVDGCARCVDDDG